MNGKEIIFRINELSNKGNQGWIPYAKPIKMFILDFISKESSRPNGTATLTTEMFSILCDLENYYQEAGTLGSDGFFYQIPRQFKDEWGITLDTVKRTTSILVNMGWIDREIRGGYDNVNNNPLNAPYYKLNHEKIINDLVQKYPSLQKLF